MKKSYFLIVLILCGLSVGNLCASAAPEALNWRLIDEAIAAGDDATVEWLISTELESSLRGEGEDDDREDSGEVDELMSTPLEDRKTVDEWIEFVE